MGTPATHSRKLWPGGFNGLGKRQRIRWSPFWCKIQVPSVALRAGLGGRCFKELERKMDERWQAVLDYFPPVEWAVAYGSGVFKQLGYEDTKESGSLDWPAGPMVDLILVVRNSQDWHAENLAINRHHYSGLRVLGPTVIGAMQDRLGAGLYFNTMVPIPGEHNPNSRLMKYGVMHIDTACADLETWKYLYFSGRMHKPVRVLQDNERVRVATTANLRKAVRVASLLLPETFTDQELYLKIASLSYHGDFRMTVGENPKKVTNIVGGNLENFRTLYREHLEKSTFLAPISHDYAKFQQNLSPQTLREHIAEMPIALKSRLGAPQDLLRDNSRRLIQSNVSKALQKIVFRYSATQSIKGIATAGLIKAAKYAGAKLAKMNGKK